MTEQTLKLRRPPAANGGEMGTRHKLFIATPAYGGMVTQEYATSLTGLCLSLLCSNVQFEPFIMGGESLITRARNKAVAHFLESDCTHLLFVDADVGFRAKDFEMLTRHTAADVVCGAYPMKNYGWENIAAAVKRGVEPDDLPAHGAMFAFNARIVDINSGEVTATVLNGARFIEVSESSTGFMLIKRDCIERMINHYGKALEYTADYPPDIGKTHYKLFQADNDPASPWERAKQALVAAALSGTATPEALAERAREYREALSDGTGRGRYLSEDYYFCRLWQDMGGSIFVAIDCRLTHTGSHTWRGRLDTILEERPSPQKVTQNIPELSGDAPHSA